MKKESMGSKSSMDAQQSVAPQPNVKEITKRIRRIVEGEVLAEEWERAIYATDGSSYEVMPLCIVIPKTELDVANTVKFAWGNNVPIIARGGASGLAGQAIGAGILLDLTKHMNKIISINTEQNYVVVEPGIYKGTLDQALKKHGLFLPPDPSSAEFCTVGGNIATNASGPRTVKYGSMINYVESLRVVLADGQIIETGPMRLDGEEWTEKTSSDTLESKAYRGVREIVEENLKLINEKQPNVTKNSSGYRLEAVIRGNQFDLGKIFVSSEGTLGIIVQAKLRALTLPKSRGLALLQFASHQNAGAAVAEILKLKPSAVEMVDDKIIDLAEAAYPELRQLVPKGAASVLLVEFEGDSDKEVNDRLQSLKTALTRGKPLALRINIAHDEAETKKLWEIRKKALPLAQKVRKGSRRPIAFIEDTVVNPTHLADYIHDLYATYEKHGVEGVVYGHAGDGHLHTRPLLDMTSEEDLRKLESIAMEVFSLVKKHNGSITGEHGDGLARTGFIPLQYGGEMYDLFKQVKQLLDPRGILNPGKKVSEAGPSSITMNLRYGEEYRRRPVKTALNWGIEQNSLVKKITGYSAELDFAREVELCHGCGYCRETTYSARMCPVYKGLGNEIDSCRGRNNLLRWMLKLQGLASSFELTDEYGEAIYKHCIQCKMCHIDCPSNVNVGKLMAEARARYASVRGLPKGYKYFIELDKYAQHGCSLAPLSNWLMASGAFRTLIEWFTGISRKRAIPPFQRKTFAERFKEYERSMQGREYTRSVAFFYDTYLNYNNPELGIAIVKILEKSGVKTIVPPQKSSGLPALVEGAPEIGRRIAEYNVSKLAPYVKKGIPVVCFSPSAGITLRLEYLNVLDSEEARLVAENTLDIHEYLYSLHKAGTLNEKFKPADRDVFVHLHCHSIVQKVDGDVLSLLRLIPGLLVERLERGCCGVGGSFSFIKDNYELSMQMGRELFEAVKNASRPVYSTGESCMLQMQQGSGRTMMLTMDLLRDAYGI
ncbi:MAG: FAD-binding protein [Thaumarchaeota archaeon]|nr:FAD-binding protein [Nitrososphaerota archaeon]